MDAKKAMTAAQKAEEGGGKTGEGVHSSKEGAGREGGKVCTSSCAGEGQGSERSCEAGQCCLEMP